MISCQMCVNARHVSLLRSGSVQRLQDRDPRQHSNPSRSANKNSVSIATCQVGGGVLGFRSAVIYSAASCSVSNSRLSGKMIGSANRLNQAISRIQIILSDVKRQQSSERKQQHQALIDVATGVGRSWIAEGKSTDQAARISQIAAPAPSVAPAIASSTTLSSIPDPRSMISPDAIR